MKAEQVKAAFFTRINSGETQLIHGLDKDQWLKTITAGQILKGRVLRIYSEKKYGIDFGGQERIVDSTVVLTKGDVITGKVLAVGEHNISMKIVSAQSADHSTNNSAYETKIEVKSPLQMESERFNVNLNSLQEAAVLSALNGSENAAVTIRVGLYLAKLGVPITIELVRALTSRVLNNKVFSPADLDKIIPILTTESTRVESLKGEERVQPNFALVFDNLKNFFLKDFNEETLKNVSAGQLNSFAQNSATLTSQSSSKNLNSMDENDNKNLGLYQLLFRLLNLSNGSYVQHRFQTLPIIINGKLIEFDVAFFDQANHDSDISGLKSKCLKFSLKTDYGLLNLDVRALNDRVAINFNSENDYLVSQIKEYESDLNSNLTEAGWKVDKIQYVKSEQKIIAAYEVINHVLMQDSLNVVV